LRCGFLIAFTSTLLCGQGVISTVAGTGNASAAGDGGPATSASFHPDGLTVDSAGNIYIADQNNNRIRKVDLNGNVTTVAGNGNTQFNGDGGLATGATVYIAANHNGLALDAAGNLYIADDGHHRIRKVNANGIITTVAGTGAQGFSGDGGPATSAQLYRPSGVAVDRAGNLYIADMLNRRIRKVDTNGIITTLAGTGAFGSTGDGGQAINATLETPVDVFVDAGGSVYFADQDANTGEH
jgi:sugar lactone lactonase YvrE